MRPEKLLPALCLALVLAAVGCARRVVAPPRVPLASEEVERLLDSVRAQASAVLRYQAVVRLRGKSAEGRFRATLIVAFERPDRLRVELLAGPFGGSQWTAVAVAEEITVFFPSRREFLRESRVAAVVGALLGVELGAREVMAILSGTGLPPETYGPAMGAREGDVAAIDMGAAEIRLREGKVESARGEGYRVRYLTPFKAAPDRIEIRAPDLEATLAVEDADVNVPLEKGVFELPIPESARRVELARALEESVVKKVKP